MPSEVSDGGEKVLLWLGDQGGKGGRLQRAPPGVGRVGEQLMVVKFEEKKLDGKVVVEEDKMLDEEEGKELEEKLILQCFLDKIPGDTD